MAYVEPRRRDEEEERRLAGESSEIAGLGGSPMGLQQSGGDVPFTNVQAYLAAGRGDTRAGEAFGRQLGETVAREKTGLEQEESRYRDIVGQAQPRISSLTGGLSGISEARQRYLPSQVAGYMYTPSRSPRSMGPQSSGLFTPYEGPGPQLEQLAATPQYNVPEWGGIGLSKEFQSVRPLSSDEKALRSGFSQWQSKQAGRPMSVGEMSLNEQLALQNVDFPGLRSTLRSGVGDVEAKRQQMISELPALQKSSQQAVSTAEKQYQDAYRKMLEDMAGFESGLSALPYTPENVGGSFQGEVSGGGNYETVRDPSAIVALAKQYGLGPADISAIYPKFEDPYTYRKMPRPPATRRPKTRVTF